MGVSLSLVVLAGVAGTGATSAHRVVRAAGGGVVTASPGLQTVFDRTLDVTWLADADLAATDHFGVTRGINKNGSMDYATAVDWVRHMNRSDHGTGYLGHHEWTLPVTLTPSVDPSCTSSNKKGGGSFGFGCHLSPLASLYATTFHLTWPASAVAMPDDHAGPFHNFQPYLYWTSGTVVIDHHTGDRTFSFNTGWQGSNVPFHDMYVLPVLPGNPFGTRATRPTGLFPSAGGATVWDPAAGVTFLADADLARTKQDQFGLAIKGDGSMQQPTAILWIDRLNKVKWLGKKGWELPPAGTCTSFTITGCTQGALSSLYYHGLGLRRGTPVVATPATERDGFDRLQPYLYWSCAGMTVSGGHGAEDSVCSGEPAAGFQWSFSFGNGFLGTDLVENDLYTTAYYPGAGSPLPPFHGGCPPHKPGAPITCS